MPNNNQSEEVERIVETFRSEIYGDNDALFDRQGNNVSTQVENHLRQTLTSHGASEYARGKSEETDKLEGVITAMSWQEKNETSEAIRVLAELRQALCQENTLKE